MGGGQDAGAGGGFGSPGDGGHQSGGEGGLHTNERSVSPPSNTQSGDGSTKTKLDYLTTDYQDIDLTPEQKETLADQRQQARYSISPMEDPKNKAIALGLSMVIPGAGSLFGAYKNSTAMGYSIDNPFSGFFTGGTGSTPPPTIGEGGDGRSQMNALAPLAPFVVSNTAPIESEASKWYNSIGTNTTNNFNFASAYANAKLNLTKNLSNHGPLAQLAVSDSPYYDWLKVNKIDKGIL
jgi:hypothetical protein